MTVKEEIQALVENRVAAFRDNWPVFSGADGGPSIDDVPTINRLSDEWITEHLASDDLPQIREVEAAFTPEQGGCMHARTEAHFRAGVLFGLEIARRLGGAR